MRNISMIHIYFEVYTCSVPDTITTAASAYFNIFNHTVFPVSFVTQYYIVQQQTGFGRARYYCRQSS